jgi:hypothetical protein
VLTRVSNPKTQRSSDRACGSEAAMLDVLGKPVSDVSDLVGRTSGKRRACRYREFVAVPMRGAGAGVEVLSVSEAGVVHGVGQQGQGPGMRRTRLFPTPRGWVGHSLGSVAAYEALCAHPQWPVRALATLGPPRLAPARSRWAWRPEPNSCQPSCQVVLNRGQQTVASGEHRAHERLRFRIIANRHSNIDIPGEPRLSPR